MSYILDALKRADAQRGRAAVPGLQARQLATPAAPGWRGSVRHLWLALEVTAALALGAVGLWVWLASPTSAPTAAVVTAPTASPTAPAAAPLPGASTAAALPMAPPPGAKPAAQRTPPPTPAAQVAASPASTAPAPAVPLLVELPQDVQRQVPPITISGFVHSKDPAQRLLLINGQVVTQGAAAAPDLMLEEIGVKSSIFSFRGTRFRLAH